MTKGGKVVQFPGWRRLLTDKRQWQSVPGPRQRHDRDCATTPASPSPSRSTKCSSKPSSAPRRRSCREPTRGMSFPALPTTTTFPACKSGCKRSCQSRPRANLLGVGAVRPSRTRSIRCASCCAPAKSASASPSYTIGCPPRWASPATPTTTKSGAAIRHRHGRADHGARLPVRLHDGSGRPAGEAQKPVLPGARGRSVFLRPHPRVSRPAAIRSERRCTFVANG